MEHTSSAGHVQLRGKVVEQLQTIYALKSPALRMFGPTLAEVHKQKGERAFPEVQDLLEKMTSAFGGHEATTREHERRGTRLDRPPPHPPLLAHRTAVPLGPPTHAVSPGPRRRA